MRNQVMTCSCEEGPYLGAQKAGTPVTCQVCGFMTSEQLDAIKAEARAEGLKVEITREMNTSARCKVWYGEQLVFDGQDHSAIFTEVPKTAEEKIAFRKDWDRRVDEGKQ